MTLVTRPCMLCGEMSIPGPAPPLEDMAPRCEVCLEVDEHIRQMLAISGQKALKVPAARWRSPYMCAACRARLVDLLRRIIELEKLEVAASVGIDVPEGTPA